MTHDITPVDAYEWLSTGKAVLIDVREPDEFKTEHIPYAASLPLAGVCGVLPQLKLPDDTKIIFQCLRGARGGQACLAAQSADNVQHEVYNIAGGISAWKEAGFPVVGQAAKLSIFRQIQVIVGFLVMSCVILGFLGFTAAFIVAGIVGMALFIAGLTGWCGLAMLLPHMPWNRG